MLHELYFTCKCVPSTCPKCLHWRLYLLCLLCSLAFVREIKVRFTAVRERSKACYFFENGCVAIKKRTLSLSVQCASSAERQLATKCLPHTQRNPQNSLLQQHKRVRSAEVESTRSPAVADNPKHSSQPNPAILSTLISHSEKVPHLTCDVLCVCVWGGVNLPLQIKSIPPLFSHLKWLNDLWLPGHLLSQHLSRRGQTNTSTFLYLQLHSICIPYMHSVVCTSTRTQVSQLFPNCKRVPRR